MAVAARRREARLRRDGRDRRSSRQRRSLVGIDDKGGVGLEVGASTRC